MALLTGLVTCPWSRLPDDGILHVLSHGNWPLAILLGAIASATAPAATVDVLWEYKTRGMLTTTVMAIVALDDGLALILFGFASSMVDLLSGNGGLSLITMVGKPLYDILGSMIMGGLMGSAYVIVLRIFYNREMILPLCVGSLLTIIGVCHYLGLDLILAAMSSGVVVVNLAPRKSREAFDQLSRFAPPIFILFFVLVGARLQPRSLAVGMLVIMDGLEDLVLACDLMEKVHAVTAPETRLVDALEKMREEDVEVLPVVSGGNDHRLVGMIEHRRIRQALHKEIILRTHEET